jgi:YVTN family beta-propeller protein
MPFLLAVLLLLAAAPVSSAFARDIYVTSGHPATNNISVIDSQTDQVVGSPIGVGSRPRAIAITPDGKLAYVANFNDGTVSVIDTGTKKTMGSPIGVGTNPRSIAITPSGRFAYVANQGSGTVSVIETATNQSLGAPITVGPAPISIAITPDGRFAYVVVNGTKNVSIIDTRTNQVVGSPIPVGLDPHGIAITPDGRLAYVANDGSNSVSAIDLQTNQIAGSPIGVGLNPFNVAITPNSRTAYAANFSSGSVSAIDTQTNEVVGSPILVGSSPDAIAIAPDGQRAYVINNGGPSVSVIDTMTNQTLGSAIPVPSEPEAIAIAPDQPPLASFAVPRARPGVPSSFVSTSSDPDGTIARYEWAFGDGAQLIGAPDPSHVYSSPGTYMATLTLTDSEGCSTAFVSAGQTAFCNGSPLASRAEAVKVAFPGVRLRCPKSAKPGGCKFKLQAVTRKRRGRAETKVARAKAKAGRSAPITLKPKKAFAAKLATAERVFVKETVTIDGSRRVLFKKLKIVQ